MNFRRRRGHVESPRTALTSRAKRASERASRAGGGARSGAANASAGWGCRPPGRAGEGRGTVDPGRRGGKKVRARPSERAGAEAGRRDATRRVELDVWQHGASAVRARCARRGNADREILTDAEPAILPTRPTLTGVRRTARRIGEGKNPVLPCRRR